MCILLPFLLMLGTAALTWLATKSAIRNSVEQEFENKLLGAAERYNVLMVETNEYATKLRNLNVQYVGIKKEHETLMEEKNKWETKYTNLFIEKEQQERKNAVALNEWEYKYRELENEQIETFKAKDEQIRNFSDKIAQLEIEKQQWSVSAPQERIITIEKPIEVIKIVEKPVEVIKEVEIIREVEVMKEIDMESLKVLLNQMGSVEISRTVKEQVIKPTQNGELSPSIKS